MKFWLQTPGSMAIDNEGLNGLTFTGLPSNVWMVYWDDDLKGEIEYNNAMGIRVPFDDPTPYLPYVDQWLTKAQAETPPINLPQAKVVKCDVVESLYHYKRQLPFSYIGYPWDATDESVSAMNQWAHTYTAQIVLPAINTAINNSIASVNDCFGTTGGGLCSDINTQLAELANDIDYKIANATIGGSTSGDPPTFTPGGITMQPITHQTVTPPQANPSFITLPDSGNMTWPPLGYNPITLSYQQFTALIGSIAQRRAGLNSVRVSKKNQINALTTIPAVIAFNTTSGW